MKTEHPELIPPEELNSEHLYYSEFCLVELTLLI
jgi:hypothetical protein